MGWDVCEVIVGWACGVECVQSSDRCRQPHTLCSQSCSDHSLVVMTYMQRSFAGVLDIHAAIIR